jgi:hypothetical protein
MILFIIIFTGHWSLGHLVPWSLVTWLLSHLMITFMGVHTTTMQNFITITIGLGWSFGHWSLGHLVRNLPEGAHNNYAKFHYNRISGTIFFAFSSRINRKVFQRVSKPHKVVHLRSMDFPNLVHTLVAMSLGFVDGHCKSESHRKLQTFELERHICLNHWNV